MFKGDYNSYLQQRDNVKEKDENKDKAVLSYEEQKKNKNKISSLEKKIVKSEERLEKLESEKAKKEVEYNEAGKINDLDKLLTIQQELEDYDVQIMEVMEEWEALEEELKNLT